MSLLKDPKPVRTAPAIIRGDEHICQKRDCYYCQSKQREQNTGIVRLLDTLDMRGVYLSNYHSTEIVVRRSKA